MPAMHEPLISGRGMPFQEKVETAEYRVVYSPSVAVRDKPWGKVVGSFCSGEIFKTTHRSIGLPDGVWVKTEKVFGTWDGRHGWVLRLVL